MSIQKMSRGPMMLMDREFNIPVFNATYQKYKCTEVAYLGLDANSKRYGLYFKEIPTSNYSVPEVLRLDLDIIGSNVSVVLYEKTKGGNYTKITNGVCKYNDIQSVAGIQQLIHNIITR
jgi:hypothetical protein